MSAIGEKRTSRNVLYIVVIEGIVLQNSR